MRFNKIELEKFLSRCLICEKEIEPKVKSFVSMGRLCCVKKVLIRIPSKDILKTNTNLEYRILRIDLDHRNISVNIYHDDIYVYIGDDEKENIEVALKSINDLDIGKIKKIITDDKYKALL